MLLVTACLLAGGPDLSLADDRAPTTFPEFDRADQGEPVGGAHDSQASRLPGPVLETTPQSEAERAEKVLAAMLLKPGALPESLRIVSTVPFPPDLIEESLGHTVASMLAGMIVQEIERIPVSAEGGPKGKPDLARCRFLAPLTGMKEDVVAELVKSYGDGTTILRVGDGAVHMSGDRDIQEEIVNVLPLSVMEVAKIKGFVLATSCRLLAENSVPAEEVRDLGRLSGVTIESGLSQVLWSQRESVRIEYYGTASPATARILQSYLVNTPMAGFCTYVQAVHSVVVLIKGTTPDARNAAVRMLRRDRPNRRDEPRPERNVRFVPPSGR
jgi:hypothetical protein